jgi:ATP-dependent Clp protease ATP-binding subunit ClpC
VARTAFSQGVELDCDANVVDHFASVGFQPEYGARELQRLIRSELETELARAMLSGSVEDGDKVHAIYETDDHKITFEKVEEPKDDAVPGDEVEPPSENPEDTTTADASEEASVG